jgi:hypothetical protein
MHLHDAMALSRFENCINAKMNALAMNATKNKIFRDSITLYK